MKIIAVLITILLSGCGYKFGMFTEKAFDIAVYFEQNEEVYCNSVLLWPVRLKALDKIREIKPDYVGKCDE